ncbi:MAG: CcmD family protein [Bacteroidia bacterium]|nr:CcmD family protein [Bacteroidia bacterium]MDW8301100.1 CcmD family protein [Bacteroidia bacterium]
MKKLLFLLLQANIPEEAKGFYQAGKIYVVVGVILIIFAGIIVYLIRLEQKIKRIEKEHEL